MSTFTTTVPTMLKSRRARYALAAAVISLAVAIAMIALAAAGTPVSGGHHAATYYPLIHYYGTGAAPTTVAGQSLGN